MNLDLAKALDRRLGSLLGRLVGGADRLRALAGSPSPVPRVTHVLVTKFWGLGNWALLRPIVRDLRRHLPQARLTVATLRPNVPLVEDLADEVLTVRARSFATVARDLHRAVRHLRAAPPELALDFEQFSRTGALLARGGRAAQRLGFASGDGGRDGLYTVLVPFRADAHVSRSFRDLAEAAGLAPAPYVPGGLAVSAAGLAAVRRAGVAEGGAYVVLHPGSGDNFPGRRWSPSGFAAVGRTARACGHAVYVTGSAAEHTLAERVAREGGGRSLAGRIDVPGLVALLAGARALVANDTGPVHLASALSVPTLAIYGPNTPVLYGPLAPGSRAFTRSLPCSPCLTTSNYRTSRCRIPVCTATIATGAVTSALARILGRVPA